MIAIKIGSPFDYWPKTSAANRKTHAILRVDNVWEIEDKNAWKSDSEDDRVHGFIQGRLKDKATGKKLNVVESDLEEPKNAEGSESAKLALRLKQSNQMKASFSSWKNLVPVMGDTNWHYVEGGRLIANKVASGSKAQSNFESIVKSSKSCSPRIQSGNSVRYDYRTVGDFKAGALPTTSPRCTDYLR